MKANVKIGDVVKMVVTLSSGEVRSKMVVVTDVFRDCLTREPLELEFTGVDGNPLRLPMEYFDLSEVFSF